MRRIESHLQGISRIYRSASSDFIEMFCPYCNDATRKSKPNHGHLYFSISTNYFHCFRCNEVGSLTRLLTHTGFTDQEALASLRQNNRDDISYFRKTKHKELFGSESANVKMKRAFEKYMSLRGSNDFSRFYAYMTSRCLDIDFSKYFVFPERKFDKLVCSFYNYDNRFVTSRFIDDNDKRYHNSKDKPLYYFQNMANIINYQEIVICEGIFDIINLHNYCHSFNRNSFYIAMNGSSYVQTIKMLLTTYLLLGNYRINIVVDKGLIGLTQMIGKSRYQVERWNKNVELVFYEPILSKDVGELMFLEMLDT